MENRKDSIRSLILFTFFLAGGVIVLWFGFDAILLAFASILLALLFQAIGLIVRKITHLPYSLSVIIGIFFFIGLLALTFWLYAPYMASQFSELFTELPKAIEKLENDLVKFLNLPQLKHIDYKKMLTNPEFLTKISKAVTMTGEAIVWFIVFIFLALYLSVNPQLYISGFLPLFPLEKRHSVQSLLGKLTFNLRLWLIAKLIAMTTIGVLTFVGLYFLKVPLPFILGLLAGLFTFVPYFGAITASIPALLLAFSKSPLLALYTLFLFMIIHFIEGYFITPLVELKTIYLPPAFTIFMQILLTLLFGVMGIVLASPISVALIVIVQHLYLKKEEYRID